MPLARLAPVLTLPGAHFVSLQYGPTSAEIGALHAHCGITLHEWPRTITDMDEVAALIASLDLIVTVCTTAVHLAGALGFPVWLLLPFAPDFRWLLDREDSPWYPTMRLFRQRRLNDWPHLLSRVHAELLANRPTGN